MTSVEVSAYDEIVRWVELSEVSHPSEVDLASLAIDVYLLVVGLT